MAFTSPKMGLRVWNLLTDLYDHAQLADNWAKVDYHDHSPGKGVQVPTEGLADGAVTSTKLAAALDPSGAYTTYRLLHKGAGAGQLSSPNTYGFTGSNFYALAQADSGRAAFYIDPDDHVVPGRTAKLRVAASLVTNAVAPANSFNFGLWPVASWGGAASATATVATVGAQVAGSGFTITTPALTTPTYNVSADFNLPTEGWYIVGVAPTGASAATSTQSVQIELQVRYV